MQTSKDFLHIFLDMGDALLNSGAEIFRVEDTLNRMGYACGAAQMNVFVITSSIVITMEFPGEGARTQTRRIREKPLLWIPLEGGAMMASPACTLT
mgnify:CR=1 FL=1